MPSFDDRDDSCFALPSLYTLGFKSWSVNQNKPHPNVPEMNRFCCLGDSNFAILTQCFKFNALNLQFIDL